MNGTVDQSEQTDDMIGTVVFDETEGTVVYKCKEHGDPILIDDVDNVAYSINSHPCESCGSHGTWSIDVECDCGNNHNIIIKVW